MSRQSPSWSEHIIEWYRGMEPPQNLPPDIYWLHPQKDPQVLQIVEQFFHKFYSDARPRRLLLGINPGRFGAGVTGVNFTAAKQLQEYCAIPYPGKGSEISAEFIYDMIMEYGGVTDFYDDFFIGSVCPLGFVRHGKNLNYYDDRELQRLVTPFIVEQVNRLLDYHVDQKTVFAIGGEKNFKFLHALNEEHRWFGSIEPLPHPRFIMQYRRRHKEQFIQQYIQALRK